MAIQAVKHAAVAVLLPAHVGVGLCIAALPPQATGTMMHIPHRLPNV